MKKITMIAFAVVLVLVALFVLIYAANKNSQVNKTDNNEEIMNELKSTILKEGEGAEAKSGSTVKVHYTGWLLDGTKFDSSLDRGMPFEFVLGAGQVIEGWDKGVLGMKKGEIRKLEIPAEMAYGDNSVGAITPGSDLVFEVEMIDPGK